MNQETIVSVVCKELSVNPNDIFVDKRHRHICDARFMIMILMRIYLRYTYLQVSEALNKDHTTIMHGLRRIRKLNATDTIFREKYKEIKLLLGLDAHLSSEETDKQPGVLYSCKPSAAKNYTSVHC